MTQPIYIILVGYPYEGYCKPDGNHYPDEFWYDEELAKKEADRLRALNDGDIVTVVEMFPAKGQE